MKAEIVSHRPGLEILVKKRKKSTVQGGSGSQGSFDLAPALGDSGTCTVSKSIYGYHGEFHIVMPDMPFEFGRKDGAPKTVDSPYGLIEPMDIVTIRMDRDTGPDMPIVMRGLVRSVGRDETVAEDGRPMRRVSIVGHDFGAVFTISQMQLLVALREKDVMDPLFAYLKQFDLIAGKVQIEEFMQKFLDFGNESMKSTGVEIKPAFGGVKGNVHPTTLPSMEGPIWVTMIRFADSPWNELFVRDPISGDAPELVFRPTPWKTTDGEFIDFEGAVQVFDVNMEDVISISAHRNDNGVANFIWVSMPAGILNEHWIPLFSPQAREIAKQTQADPNSTKEIYGNRVLNQSSYIGPGPAPGANPEKEQKKSEIDWNEWRLNRIKWMHKATEDNADFEQGSLTVKGDPKYRVGNYLELKRGIPWEGYLVGVRHEFRAFRDYLTTLDFIRGNGFIERVKAENPWFKERKKGNSS